MSASDSFSKTLQVSMGSSSAVVERCMEHRRFGDDIYGSRSFRRPPWHLVCRCMFYSNRSKFVAILMINNVTQKPFWGNFGYKPTKTTLCCESPEVFFLRSGLLIWNWLPTQDFVSSLASEHICTQETLKWKAPKELAILYCPQVGHEVMRFGMFIGTFYGTFATRRPHLRPKPKSMTCTIWIRGPMPNLRKFHRISWSNEALAARIQQFGVAKHQVMFMKQHLNGQARKTAAKSCKICSYLWPLVLISNLYASRDSR